MRMTADSLLSVIEYFMKITIDCLPRGERLPWKHIQRKEDQFAKILTKHLTQPRYLLLVRHHWHGYQQFKYIEQYSLQYKYNRYIFPYHEIGKYISIK